MFIDGTKSNGPKVHLVYRRTQGALQPTIKVGNSSHSAATLLTSSREYVSPLLLPSFTSLNGT
jgi:hypothetical protein